jgi:hypothetical protein
MKDYDIPEEVIALKAIIVRISGGRYGNLEI